MDYLAVCSRLPGNELIAAECEALTGGKSDENGIAACQRVDLIAQSAFIQRGVQLLASADCLEALVELIARQSLQAEDFRIELLRFSNSLPVQRQEAILAIANTLQTTPNLDEPQHRFLLLARKDRLEFGEILTECQHAYMLHATKPYHTSSSLDARLARGMVNLVMPRVQTILDPCCGTGSILLEAQALGLEVFGSDLNRRMVGMAQKNLAHYGYRAEIIPMDARQSQQTADAVVTDLPYGLMQVMVRENLLAILANCANLAPVGVFAAGQDITPWLAEAGYEAIEVFQVKKRSAFTRYIHRAHSRCIGTG
jgi:tRNA G10  N-methylase Trm11